MGTITVTEQAGLRIERLLENTERETPQGNATPGANVREPIVMGLGIQGGLALQFQPPQDETDCPKPGTAYYYSPPRHPDKELRACRSGYTYWALSAFSGLMKQSSLSGASSSLGTFAALGLSFNWTWTEKPFHVRRGALDGSDAKATHPLRIGLELVGQYSSLPHSLGAGLGPTFVIADKLYLNGAFILNREGASSYFISVGLRDFL